MMILNVSDFSQCDRRVYPNRSATCEDQKATAWIGRVDVFCMERLRDSINFSIDSELSAVLLFRRLIQSVVSRGLS